MGRCWVKSVRGSVRANSAVTSGSLRGTAELEHLCITDELFPNECNETRYYECSKRKFGYILTPAPSSNTLRQLRSFPPLSFHHHSSAVPIDSQSPSKLSFHNVTLLSPQLTASTLPIIDQLTRQTTSGNCSAFSGFRVHGVPGDSCAQINTVLSYTITK